MIARGPENLVRAAEEATVIAAQEDPGNPFAQFTLASLAYRAGSFRVAERAFTRTLELDPDRPGMRHYYRRLLREMGKLEESERQLRIALEQASADDTHTRINLSETLVARGKIDEAEALLRGVLAKEPNDAEALVAMGRLLVARGKAKDAVPYLEKAAKGRDVEPWIELALVHLAAVDATKVREAAGEALGRNPNHPWALAVMGHVLVAEGRRSEGVDLLHKALALRPRRPEVWMSLARAFEAAGDATKAALCRRKASLPSS